MPDKKKWGFSNLHEVHVAANALLRQAILNERYKRWRKVVDLYRELLWMIALDKLPADYEPPSSYNMLLYELHFHLGVAYQQLDDHRSAVKEFSRTIEVVSIAKNGCLAGCLTNSCLMTPIYTRRAFAHAQLGSYKLSLKDAEKAVVLDSKSPDVYCIRALVRSTFDDELVGLKDLDRALTINPDHVCAIMLKASFTKPLFPGSQASAEYEKLKAKAVRLCQEAETYLTCNSFTHPCILEFYDKFLFPLSVPHTITSINLTPEKPSKKQLESSYASKSTESASRPTSAATQLGSSQPDTIQGFEPKPPEAFRCGTPMHTANNRISWKRRTDYSDAVRKYMARPKSASEFFEQLERHRRREATKKRAQSSIVRPGQRFALQTPTNEAAMTRPSTAPSSGNHAPTIKSSPLSHDPTATSPVKNDDPVGYSVKQTRKKKFEIETPSNYSIPVFQGVNIRFAPRMYYRPWIGDKLPVAERSSFKFSPKFY